ncbi:hypothetical protein U9M48_029239 [Paspalum notatum var. saurae]|uniref:Uncharacterized protein n=1 Tax=Paspalum notatum var. saurae TaxID=547442 RepID=A0AAQ3X0X9_PASNO
MLLLYLSAATPLGLQTLIAADADDPASSSSSAVGRNVATRTIAASPRAVRRCLADGGDADDGGGGGGEGPAGDGCWVSYGWRRRPRRLPPAIPPLRPLARERTADGRLVISREEAARRVCARKVVEDRRLVLELIDERRGGGAAPPPQRRRWSHPPVVAQEASTSASAAAGEEDAARDSSASPVPAEACFEGVIRAASLSGMRVSLQPRMVH